MTPLFSPSTSAEAASAIRDRSWSGVISARMIGWVTRHSPGVTVLQTMNVTRYTVTS
jgi:hypothetical protein